MKTDRERLVEFAQEVMEVPFTYPGLCVAVAKAKAILDELDPPPLPYKGREANVEEGRRGWVVYCINEYRDCPLHAHGDTREQAIARYNACVKAIEAVA